MTPDEHADLTGPEQMAHRALAEEPAADDVESLTRALWYEVGGDWDLFMAAVAARDARVKAEERERIAQAIEALPEHDGAGWPNHAYEIKADAARIAREGDTR